MRTLKTAAILSIALFSYLLSNSQAPAIQWQKAYGGSGLDQANCIRQTADGGYIVGGITNSFNGDVSGNHGSQDYWIVKIDDAGAIQWKKCFGGSDIDFMTYKIEQAADGGFICVGWTRSVNGNVALNKGGDDCWVLKLSSTGDIEWQRSIGGSSNDYGTSVALTNDGGYIVTGEVYSGDGDAIGNHGSYDYIVVKLKSNGTTDWRRVYGGSNVDEPMDIEQTAEGGYIVTGSSASNDGDVSGNHGYYDFWVLKLNSGGSVEWQKSLGGSGSDSSLSIQQTSDLGYIVGGSSNSNNGDVTGNHGMQDFWIVKLTAEGNLSWQKSFGGSLPDVITFGGQQTTDGSYVFSGWTYSNNGDVNGNHGLVDMWVLKCSETGELKWQKCLGGTNADAAVSMQQTNDGGFIVAGVSYSTNGDVTGNHGGGDFWVVKLSPDAVLAIAPLKLTASPQNNYVLLNWSNENEAGIESYTIQRSTDALVFSDIAEARAGKQTYSLMDAGAGIGKIQYRLKLNRNNGLNDYSKIIVVEISKAKGLSIFPNPATNVLNLSFESDKSETKIVQIHSIDGKLLITQVVNCRMGLNKLAINITAIQKGTYLVSLKDKNISVNKFIKL